MTRTTASSLLILAVTCAAGCRVESAPAPPLRSTDAGPVRGVEESELLIFRGIPYAEPPLGELRFQAPKLHSAWEEPLDAVEFGPACPQDGMMIQEKLAWSEDCLTLNVWTHKDGKPRPVMVFVHGGGFIDDASSRPLYDGARLASAGDVVVLSLNYRLGPLGFLADESLPGGGGNFGLRDQVAALEWVERNIAEFGGDPDNVTLFGESAGAISVCAHLASPLSEGLFDRAIVQSSTGCAGFPAPDEAPAGGGWSPLDFGASIIGATSCADAADKAACLRGLEPEELLAAFAQLVEANGFPALAGFSPVVDGEVLTSDLIDAWAEGSARDVPVIIGANAEEWSMFSLGGADPAPETEAELNARVEQVFGPLASGVLGLYTVEDFGSAALAYEALMRDMTFVCPSQGFAEVAGGGPEPAYSYHFTHVMGGELGARLGAAHMFELGYVFDSLEAMPFIDYLTISDADRELVERIQLAWSSFAHEGRPSLDPAWEPTSSGSPRIALLDNSARIVEALPNSRCEGLRALGLVR